MSALPIIYRIAFQEASKNYTEFPKLVEQIKQLEQRLASQPTKTSERKEAAPWAV